MCVNQDNNPAFNELFYFMKYFSLKRGIQWQLKSEGLQLFRFFLIYQHYHHFSLCQWTHKAFNLRRGEFFSLIYVVGKFTLHKVYSSNTDFRLHSRKYQDNSSLNVLKHYFEKFSTMYYSKLFKTVLFQFTFITHELVLNYVSKNKSQKRKVLYLFSFFFI